MFDTPVPQNIEDIIKTEEIIADAPYVEDVLSAAGIYETDDNSQAPLCVIVIIIAAAVFSLIAVIKRFAGNKC